MKSSPHLQQLHVGVGGVAHVEPGRDGVDELHIVPLRLFNELLQRRCAF